jgi:hypothetical protein
MAFFLLQSLFPPLNIHLISNELTSSQPAKKRKQTRKSTKKPSQPLYGQRRSRAVALPIRIGWVAERPSYR